MDRRDWSLRVPLPVFGMVAAIGVAMTFGQQGAEPSVDCSEGAGHSSK